MSRFHRNEIRNTLTAAVGAFVLTTTCVLAAAGPARAADRPVDNQIAVQQVR